MARTLCQLSNRSASGWIGRCADGLFGLFPAFVELGELALRLLVAFAGPLRLCRGRPGGGVGQLLLGLAQLGFGRLDLPGQAACLAGGGLRSDIGAATFSCFGRSLGGRDLGSRGLPPFVALALVGGPAGRVAAPARRPRRRGCGCRPPLAGRGRGRRGSPRPRRPAARPRAPRGSRRRGGSSARRGSARWRRRRPGSPARAGAAHRRRCRRATSPRRSRRRGSRRAGRAPSGR